MTKFWLVKFEDKRAIKLKGSSSISISADFKRTERVPGPPDCLLKNETQEI